MTPENRELLVRLERHDLDGGRANAPFTARLARENGWTLAYARRVCDEYKRFVVLTTSVEHPCTPSDQVDQAWHLHLIDTREYWEPFCAEVLGRPFHHTPTRGGPVEAAKFFEQCLRMTAPAHATNAAD